MYLFNQSLTYSSCWDQPYWHNIQLIYFMWNIRNKDTFLQILGLGTLVSSTKNSLNTLYYQ